MYTLCPVTTLHTQGRLRRSRLVSGGRCMLLLRVATLVTLALCECPKTRAIQNTTHSTEQRLINRSILYTCIFTLPPPTPSPFLSLLTVAASLKPIIGANVHQHLDLLTQPQTRILPFSHVRSHVAKILSLVSLMSMSFSILL